MNLFRRPAATSAADDLVDALRLARTDGVGPIAWRRLLARFGTPSAALAELPGLARAGGRDAAPRTPTRAEAEREIAAVEKLGGRFLVMGEKPYPALLATADDAPPVLACLGDDSVLQQRAVAIVGSRNASSNGQRIAEMLAADLAKSGLLVVSGLARGIDTAAHEGALAHGQTVACVAGGLDIAYPPENAALQARIAQRGAVLAEAPLGTAPLGRAFPRRNRIIAAMSLGTVVVEAAPRSGSLLTARMAADAGREVFAVPGSPLDPRARGTNNLIREGAALVETAADVLRELPQTAAAPAPRTLGEPPPAWEDPELHAKIKPQLLELISPSPTPVDDLIRRCQVSAAAVMAILLELEVAGRIESLPGNRVALIAKEP
jgi:DNA processing protein